MSDRIDDKLADLRRNRKAQQKLYEETARQEETRTREDMLRDRKLVWEQLQKHLPFIADEMKTNDMLQNLNAIELRTPDGHFRYQKT